MNLPELHHTNPADFEQQYRDHKSIFPTEDGDVAIVNILPTTEHKKALPILIVPGWSENQDTYKKSMLEIYESGREAMTIEYNRSRETKNPHETYPSAEFRKARQLVAGFNMLTIKQVDAILHSEGAIVGLMAAMIQPSLFRNIVLDKPSGLIGEDSSVRLMGRFIKLLASEAFERKPFSLWDPTNSFSSSKRALEYVAGNPLGALEEASALTNEDLSEIMYELIENRGISISIIAGVNDPLYPISRQFAHLEKVQSEHDGKLPIDGFYLAVGGHNEISINPKHTKLAIDALNNMERKRRNQSSKTKSVT